ncbi:hypothetical protein LMH87_007518 [Akanthomyces muscarius]|uniref:Zn(2)-C6 fungal-type domain-containing protein n=1 Tax=Akanthomyces muscarius TaxID=2231603 RepID=A0A9W8QT44_AKAMU|nr:hypothetical protein LMH87_007518 [Akanthomyces muscarius]KAJ4165912.1 hypothetical protein LMH87_007518 [Akanthomyces muscarius]
MASNSQSAVAPRLRKKRTPTACGACRASKVRCNGGNPCTRCRSLMKSCNFTERPKEPYQEKIDALSAEVSNLRKRFSTSPSDIQEPVSTGSDSRVTAPLVAVHDSASQRSSLAHREIQPAEVNLGFRRSRRSHFTTKVGQAPDFVSVGLITSEQADRYFSTFFDGCDHYVPVFDPGLDTVQSVRQRSSLLFGAICTVGCRVVCGTESRQWRLLNFHLKRMLGSVMSAPGGTTMETVQALLVRACYSAERSILVASAIRLAIDIGLPSAYDELIARISNNEASDTVALMCQARTWLHVLVLSHILHVDAGDMLTVRFAGDPRRARIILDDPRTTVLDRFLFAVYEDEEDILLLVRDSKIDIELWHGDWERILQQMTNVPPWIVVNLRVQKCWATTMALCRAVRIAGTDNVEFMSPAQRSILSMAKESLRLHLQTIISEPRSYLHNLKYAMDFVWAKCAFCYLLLLKLCILLPEENGSLNDDLIACGSILSRELSDAGGAGMMGISNSTAKMYLQLLQIGTEKFTGALQGILTPPANLTRWLDDILLSALNGGGDFYGFMEPALELGEG